MLRIVLLIIISCIMFYNVYIDDEPDWFKSEFNKILFCSVLYSIRHESRDISLDVYKCT